MASLGRLTNDGCVLPVPYLGTQARAGPECPTFLALYDIAFCCRQCGRSGEQIREMPGLVEFREVGSKVADLGDILNLR